MSTADGAAVADAPLDTALPHDHGSAGAVRRRATAARRDAAVGAFDRPAPPSIERPAAVAARRLRDARWAPVVVTLVGYLGLALSLLVVGVLLTHAGVLGGLRAWDQHVNATLAAHRTPAWTTFSSVGSKSAETLPIVLGALLLEAVLAVLRRWRDLVVVAAALVVEITVFLTVNELVRRPRPSVARLGSTPSTFSFPSGHVAATVVLWGTVAVLLSRSARSWLVPVLSWLTVAALATSVGFARVYRGMHHVTDVVAGAVMGLACLVIGTIAARSSSLAADLAPVPSRRTHRPDHLEVNP